eukprot:CAMPEP_0117015804 /NCGR_PEP_ID=MMETSP0472-20121206/12550_1 /TAXON_ID=693140 ORGANISM="Tiarina fusus, Strain LIS" /NCGR_SAMPLE_ID=MMETSP0472 /ASSEMBLY_ACC=CAM_ASM_000603 /LENGTH=374 /DNA_ID=CAMNT_0004719671 /DNA_START=313 /DNA_END=1437 /DNA_ORIENTATION=-
MSEMKQKIDSKKLSKPPAIATLNEVCLVSSLRGEGKRTSKLKTPKKKYVRFDAEKTREHRVSCMIDDLNTSTLWYSSDDIEEFRVQVKRAEDAVNDACGDIDIVRDVERCVQAVTRRQREEKISPEDLAYLSEEMSSESTNLAKLYARVLEKDIQEESAVSYDLLLGIVNEVLYDNHADDSSSVGTIDGASDTANGSASAARGHQQSKSQPLSAAMDGSGDPDGNFPENPTGIGVVGPSFAAPYESERLKNASLEHMPARDSQESTIIESPERKKSAIELGASTNMEANNMTTDSQLGNGSNNLRYAGAKRSLEMIEEDASDLVWKAPPSDTAPNVRRRKMNALEETQDRCNVAHALISLARWEFRAHSIVPKP